MSLFVDGTACGVRDLSEYDGTVVDVANIEGIDLATKVAVGAQEISTEIVSFLRSANSPQQFAVEQVVVNDALRQWWIIQSLVATYRDAYGRQLNDRYLGKWKEYERLAQNTAATLFRSGVAVVYRPLPAAPTPQLSTVAGNYPAATYYVRASWTDEGGHEGEAGASADVTITSGAGLQVQMPPAPAGPTGWNVYVGLASDDLSRQNDFPLLPGAGWILPESGLRTGDRPSRGQRADELVVRRRMLLRG
jgi:hypothetical protein